MRVLFILWATVIVALATTFNGSTGGSASIKSYQTSDLGVTFTVTPVPRVTSQGGTSSAAVNGRNILTSTTATVKFDQQITANLTGTKGSLVSALSMPWTSSNTGVATITAGGFATHASDGAASFNFATPYGIFGVPITFTTTSGTTSSSFTSWVSGLLPADANSQVDTLISTYGGTPASTMPLFSAANDTTFTYTRNTSIWTHGIDWSGISVWNNRSDGYNSKFQINLITPTDFIFCAHTPPGVGTMFKFVDNANVTYTATVAAVTTNSGYGVGGTSSIYTDICIGHLTWSGTTPTTLAVYKILPANFQNYVADRNLNYCPVVGINQARQAYVRDLATTGFTSTFCQHNAATETTRSPFTYTAYSGDSGIGLFFILKGNPILIGCNYTTGSDSLVATSISAINTALSTVGSSYSATVYDPTADGFSTQ